MQESIRSIANMPSRKLAAIMFTDVVGYTSLMGTDEQAAMEVLQQNRQIHKDCARKFKGKLLKEMGDGQMLSFTGVIDAVQCAGAIIEAVEEQSSYKLKIGVHLGEVTFDRKDVLVSSSPQSFHRFF